MDPVTIGAAALAAPAVLDGVGNLWDSIFGDDEAEAHRKALQEAQSKMWAYRPEAQQARMNVMGNMSHAFAPMNNALTSVYGPGAAIDMSKIIQNPFANIPQQQPRDRTPKTHSQPVGQYYSIGDADNGGGQVSYTSANRYDPSYSDPYFAPDENYKRQIRGK